MIQSVLFDKKLYNVEEALTWLYNHMIYPMKPAHETENYLSFRINNPTITQYYSKYIDKGILFVFAK